MAAKIPLEIKELSQLTLRVDDDSPGLRKRDTKSVSNDSPAPFNINVINVDSSLRIDEASED